MPGLINLDFSDVQSVMADMGNALMGKSCHLVYRAATAPDSCTALCVL